MSAAVEREIVFGKRVESIAEEFRRRMAPPGGIPNIHPLLEQRRHLYAIPDGAFDVQPAFNVCLVHQVPRFEQDTYGDTGIVMPQSARRRVEEETPRGILVGAGMNALDCLRSNGIDLGHMITFIRQAPWRMPCSMVEGVDFYLIILRAGDITGSEDLRQDIAQGRCKIEYQPENSQHVLVDQEGRRWDPRMPFIGEDY